MKADLSLRELPMSARLKSETKAASLRERQKELRRQHVAAFRRAMRRLRESTFGESLG